MCVVARCRDTVGSQPGEPTQYRLLHEFRSNKTGSEPAPDYDTGFICVDLRTCTWTTGDTNSRISVTRRVCEAEIFPDVTFFKIRIEKSIQCCMHFFIKAC